MGPFAPLGRATQAWLTLSALVVAAGVVFATDTARVGGPGGSRTVVLDCGSSAFAVGASASGGRDLLVAPNLLRRLRLECRPFSGSSFGSSTSQTVEAVASARAGYDASSNARTCPSTMAITSIELKAGLYIDRLHAIGCETESAGSSWLPMNVGGDGGARAFVECPQGQALYRIEVKLGAAIDSLKGSCRAFGQFSSQPLLVRIRATITPNPGETPLKIQPGRSATIQFTLPADGVNQQLNAGVTGETDLAGGGRLNPPEYKIDLIKPSGGVVATRHVRGGTPGVYETVSYKFDVSGTWRVRITNLKSYGALDVKSFAVMYP